jgi:hypothetical protein
MYERKLYGPRSCKAIIEPNPKDGHHTITRQSRMCIVKGQASYKLKHLSKDLNLSKMGSKSSYNNEKLSIAT